MPLTANWSYPTAIRFGAGRIGELAEACRGAGISRPLLVTDRGLAELEITSRTLDLLEAAGLGRALFADVDPNPNERNVEVGIRQYREGGHDGVVAFGGGSGLPPICIPEAVDSDGDGSPDGIDLDCDGVAGFSF